MVPPAPPPPPREDQGGPLHELHRIRERELLHACYVDHDCFQRSNHTKTKGDETNRHCGNDDIKEWELDVKKSQDDIGTWIDAMQNREDLLMIEVVEVTPPEI